MRNVYEASSAVQAHLLQDLLRQHGIASHVQGEHLQGAIGELPAGSLVRLLVDDADYDAARRALDDWERAAPMDEDELASQDRSANAGSAPPADTPEDASPRHKTRHPIVWAAGGAALALALQFLLTGVPVQSTTQDYNGDGVPDETMRMNAMGSAMLMERDRNVDGKIDEISEFDGRGSLLRIQADDDFNGTMETNSRYRHNLVEELASDTDGDGLIDLKIFYRLGLAERIHYIHRNTGKPARVDHMRMGKIERTELDRNANGQLDTELRYDINGHITSERPIAETSP